MSTPEIPEELIDWLEEGERGSSSEFITHTLYGLPKQEAGSYHDPSEYSFPYDAGDLGRCLKLISEVPEI